MMKMKFAIILLSIFCITACGTAQQNEKSGDSGKRPAWANVPEKIEKADAVLFVGESYDAKSAEDAAALALENAFSKVSNSFGVAVKSEFRSHEVEKNGEYSYAIGVKSSVTGKQIEVKNYRIKDMFHERNTRKHNAFVLLSIPKTELARIQTEVDGFGVWALRSGLPGSAGKIRELFPLFNKKGIKFNEETDFEKAQDIDKIAAESQKAFLLKIECDEKKAEEYNGEFYSIILIKAELFNLLTQETVEIWNVEAKGAAYSTNEAREDGITKAVREISEQIIE